MSDEQRNTKPVDDNYQADLDDVGFWLRVALLQPPQMSYGGVSVKTIPTEQIKAMLRTLDQQATFEAERDAARAACERLRAVIDDAAAFLSGEAKQLSIESEQGWDDTAAVEYRAEADKLRAALGTEADHD